MTNLPETTPGVTPSQGAIRPGRVISASHGANSGLAAQPGAPVLVSGICSRESTLDIWSTEPPRHAASLRLELELADVGTTFDNVPLPPDADADRAAWSSHLLPVLDVAASLNVTRIAVTAARCIRMFRVGAGSWDAVSDGSLRGHPGTVSRVAMSARGDRVASIDQTGAVMVWSADSRTQIHRLRISKVPHSVAFIWNDLLVAVGDEIGRVVCWEMNEGKRHLQFQAHRGAVERIVFSQEAGLMLTVGADQTARLWNLEQGAQVGRALAHRGGIRDATFAAGGRYVVTAGADGSVGVWTSQDGSLVDWMGGAVPLTRVAYLADRAEVVVASMQSIRAIEVDWARIRELDAAVRASAAHAPVADRTLQEPPTRVVPNYTGAMSAEVPVGSIMQARQTGDLPYPDRSNLVLNRPAGVPTAGAPVAGPSVGGSPFGAPVYATAAMPAVTGPVAPAAPMTAVMPPIAPAPPVFGTRPPIDNAATLLPGAPDPRPRGVPSPGGAPAPLPGFGAAPARDYGSPSTDDFFAGVGRGSGAAAPISADPAAAAGSPAAALPSAPHKPVAAPPPPVAARPSNNALGAGTPPWNNAVGAHGLPQRPTAAMGAFTGSRLPTDQPMGGRGATQAMSALGPRPPRHKTDPAGQRSAASTAAPPVNVRVPVRDKRPTPISVPRTIEDQLLADAPEDTKGVRKPIALPPRRELGSMAAFVVVLAGAIVGFIGYFGVYTYYTTQAFPSVVQAQAAAIEAQFTTREGELQDELAAFREQRESQLRTYENNGTMLPSDLERVRLQVNRQIEQRQTEVNASIDRARIERDNDLGSLGEARAAAAAKLGTIAGAVLGLIALAIGGGVLAVRRRES